MSLHEPKNVMIDILWANNYTQHLMGLTENPGVIDNQGLDKKNQKSGSKLVEDKDYVLINNTTWEFLVEIYKGGPLIFTSDFNCENMRTLNVGLYNEDNYSHLNAVMQCMLSIEPFVNFFNKYDF